jgi:hypothetical protein
VHDFLAKCTIKLEAPQIAILHQIEPNFGVEQSLIGRFKLALIYSPLDELELGVGVEALEPLVGGSRSHPISHQYPHLLPPL